MPRRLLDSRSRARRRDKGTLSSHTPFAPRFALLRSSSPCRLPYLDRGHQSAILVLEDVAVEHVAANLLVSVEAHDHVDSPRRWHRDRVVPLGLLVGNPS